MIRYPSRLLDEDEQVLLLARPHWRVLLPALLWAMVVAAVAGGVFAALGPDHLGVISAGAVALWALGAGRRVARWRAARHVLTTERLILRRGVFSRTGNHIPLASIEEVHYHQRLRDRLVGSGALALTTTGRPTPTWLHDVRHPRQVQALVVQACGLRRGAGAASDAARFAEDDTPHPG